MSITLSGAEPGNRTVTTDLLLIETDDDNARVIREALSRDRDCCFEITRVRRLNEALARLAESDTEVILVGPELPDSESLGESIRQVRDASQEALILPLSGDAEWLPHTLRYVIQRKSVEAGLRATEQALFEEKEWARVTLSSIGDAVIVTDPDGCVTYLNPMAETMTGWACEEAVGEPLGEVFHIISGQTRELATNPALYAIEQDRTVGLDANCILVRRDGEENGIEDSAAPVHNRNGEVSGAVIVFRDISQSQEMTRKMAYLAHHDSLTGLCNRALLDERLKQAIRLAQRHQKQTALLFVDLDGFKRINDTLGHAVGDHVLQAVAEVLSDCVRTTDTVCRHGGDEFVILLTEIERPEDAIQVADKILASFATPLIVEGHPLRLNLSLGISVYPEDGDSTDAIFERADAAMYHAKISQHPNYGFAQRDRDSWPTTRDCIDRRLARAFEMGEFVLHYQPQIDMVTGRIGGVEVLVRWLDSERGLVYPSQFMPVAERTGLIIAIGRWIIQEACRQVAVWRREGHDSLPVAINVSAMEFHHPHFVPFVREVLHETGIDPSDLELEFTESVLMHEPELSMTHLQQLRDIGVRLAMDDFGSGESSLRYLNRFPIDTLKIDKCLMEGVTADPATSVVLRSLVAMGKDLKRRLVAEGVETAHQLGFVQTQLFDVAQGFRFGYPQTSEDFSRLLEKEH